jgi:hypothetical protein
MYLKKIENSPRRRLVSGASSLLVAAAVTAMAIGTGAPAVVAAPDVASSVAVTARQNVDWMSADTASYLGSIGMDVMVPSWVPSPFSGVAPDVYAGDGSYSIYWMMPSEVPTFLHITGVVGAAFPDGSKADLNIPLSVNSSVQGWPAIRDIGIPAGGTTQIYDQVWWIAGGVRYSVESNNIGADSLSIAEGMVYFQAPAPEPTEPPYVPPTEPPYVPPTEAPYVPPTEEPYVPPTEESGPVIEEPVAPPTQESGGTTPQPTEETEGVPVSGSQGGQQPGTQPSTGDGTSGTTPTPAPVVNDGTVPSDGTAGPRPPVIGGDGTGGWFDTSLPRIRFTP